MRGGVIGGICLLTFLLSKGRGDELVDSKQLDESKESTTKVAKLSIEDSEQSTNGTKTSTVTPNDLNNTNSTLVINATNSIVKEAKPSGQSRKTQQHGADVVSPLDNSKNPASSSNQKESYKALDTQFNVEYELPVDGVNGRDDNIDKISHLIPQGLAGLAVPTPKSYTSIQNTGINSGWEITKETKETENNGNTYYSGLNILPPLYSAHIAATNKVAKDNFSPLFSVDSDRGQKNDMERENAQTLPSYFISNPAFEETRRDSKPEDIQVRNVDESQYNESMNEYPYSPPNTSDSTSSEFNQLRSGLYYDSSYSPFINKGMSSAKAYAGAQAQAFSDTFIVNNQASNPYSYGYPSEPVSNSIITASANAQATSSGSANAQSRIIWPNELISPNAVPGGENVIQCTRENEMYHFWSIEFDCSVCICINIRGLLQPLCAKCSGCQKLITSESQAFIPEQYPPTPESYVPLPLPDPYVPLPLPDIAPNAPSPPSFIFELTEEQNPTTSEPVREGAFVSATCSPLPTGQPFTNPLHPCQVCICKETVIAPGRIDARIECQDSHNCVLPPDATTIPSIPDVPVLVPHPACEKFPPHVTFPHPTETCKQCKCSLELSDADVPERQITCYYDTYCVPKIETTSEPITPPAPPIPIPVEPYTGPSSPGPHPNAVTPEEPIPWPPISTPAPPMIPLLPKKGPLPGPSPHDSCRPYPPNQPFQHPWDECQVCTCFEVKSIGVVNVEISCYTKLSCCIVPPDQVITAVGEASSGVNNKAVVYGPVNGFPVSTFKPLQLINTYNSDGSQNQGYTGATAIVKNSDLYGTANIEHKGHSALSPYNSEVSQNQAYAEASAVYNSPSALNPYYFGVPQNQAYAEANAEYNSPSALSPYKSGISQNQAYAEANAEYDSPSVLNPFSSGVPQNSAYAEANAEYNGPVTPRRYNSEVTSYAEANTDAQSSLSNFAYQPSASYQSSIAKGSMDNGGTNEKYKPSTVTYKPPLRSRYNAVPLSQGYPEVITQHDRIVSTTYKPPGQYTPYNAEISQNKAYAEAITQYKDFMKPGNSQNQAIAKANAKYNSLMTSTYKPSMLYNQFKPEQSQNQVYAQTNTKYNDLLTSTPRSAVLYSGYNTAVPQDQATANSLYRALALTGKPPLFNPYVAGGSQNQAYSEQNAMSLVADKNYYLSGPHQTATALGSASNGGDQSLARVEALAQSQDSLYLQPGLNVRANSMSNPSLRYPSNNYYQNPQYSSFSSKPDSGFSGKYETIPVQYAGNYEYNGQPDAINILSSPNSYNPYTSAYSQGISASKLYPSLYTNRNNYGIIPSYHLGHIGGVNGQSTAQALTGIKKYQSKSGEGYESDSYDAK